MVDGVVMCSQAFEKCSEETERIKRAYGGILPLVTVNAESEGVSSVIYDFRPGMRDLLEYFAGCGIRQLVMLDDPGLSGASGRLHGVRAGVRDRSRTGRFLVRQYGVA